MMSLSLDSKQQEYLMGCTKVASPACTKWPKNKPFPRWASSPLGSASVEIIELSALI